MGFVGTVGGFQIIGKVLAAFGVSGMGVVVVSCVTGGALSAFLLLSPCIQHGVLQCVAVCCSVL